MSTNVSEAQVYCIRCDYPGCDTQISFAWVPGTFKHYGDAAHGWNYVTKSKESKHDNTIPENDDVWTFCPEHPSVRVDIDFIRMIVDADRNS